MRGITSRQAEIELEPTLDACVETLARRMYNQILSELLRGGKAENLSWKLETLRLFLETADFGKLRRQSEKHLAAGKKVRFTLRRDRGKIRHEIKIE